VGRLQFKEPLIGLVDTVVELDPKSHGIALIGQTLDHQKIWSTGFSGVRLRCIFGSGKDDHRSVGEL
jgi:hypothetical protein